MVYLLVYLFALLWFVEPPTATTTDKWLAFLTPVMISVLTVIQLVSTLMNKRNAAKASEDSEKVSTRVAQNTSAVKQVAEVTAQATTQAADARLGSSQQMDVLQGIAEKTHTLVNSQHGLALSSNLALALQVVSLTEDPKAKAIAQAAVEVAQQKLDEHEAKQTKVDNAETRKSENKPVGAAPVTVTDVSPAAAKKIVDMIPKIEP